MGSQTNCVMIKSVHTTSIILGRKHESIDMYKFQVRFQINQVTGFDKLSCAYNTQKFINFFQARRVLDWLVNCLEKQLHLILEYADYSVYSTIIPLCNTNAKKYCKAASYGRPLQMASIYKITRGSVSVNTRYFLEGLIFLWNSITASPRSIFVKHFSLKRLFCFFHSTST